MAAKAAGPRHDAAAWVESRSSSIQKAKTTGTSSIQKKRRYVPSEGSGLPVTHHRENGIMPPAPGYNPAHRFRWMEVTTREDERGFSMNDKSRKLFLVDGSALAYRSHFGFIRTPLINSKGMNTGAIMGYARTLLRLIREEHPTHMAVAFDTPEPTFRHEMYPPYKATREKMPEEMVGQLPWMKKITEALAIPVLELPGWEADDVIGTLAKKAEEEGFEVRIVTGDKDFMQIVSPRVVLHDILKQGSDLIVVDPAKVKEKFGVPPEKVIDVLALMGDSSDNVPGVKGVGPKTALKLIDAYGSVEGVLEAAPSIPQKKLRENLIHDADMARLSKDLVTIRLDCPIDADPKDLKLGEPDRETLDGIFKELEFRSLRQELSAPTKTVEKHYEIVKDKKELQSLISKLRKAGNFVVDTETTSLNPLDAELVGFSFSIKEGEAFYVPLNAEPPVLPDDGVGTHPIVKALAPLLGDPCIGKVAQNIKYDASVIATAGVQMRGIWFDTMIASYLLDPMSRSHDLDSLSLRHFDYTKVKTSELIGSGKDQITMDQVPVDVVGEYAAEDADFTFRLQQLFARRLEEEDLRNLFDRIEMPLVPILVAMERAGIRLDVGALRTLQSELESQLRGVEQEIYALAGETFKINSPKQLSEILFEKLELHKKLGTRVRKTKTGYSTGQEVLEAMTGHPLPAKVLEYRSLSKLLSTYVISLPKLVRPSTGRIHTSYNQAVAATGRLSSSDPNLQNIPIRSELGRRVRSAFVASAADWKLVSADYSQVELRILAHICKEEAMLEAFARGADIHRETAARVFGVPAESVDPDMRSKAKSINFGIIYGMGPQRLARETEMTVDQAKEFIDRYFENFPKVKDYIEAMHAKAREEGFVTTLFGRKRPIPEILSPNGAIRSNAENVAVNTPIQGTGADIIKLAMIEVDRWMRAARCRGLMILQVHDELIFDVPDAEVPLFQERIPAIMSGVVRLDVPLVVDVGVGRNWTEAH